MTDAPPPTNMREVMNLAKDGTCTIIPDATEAELRQVITMLAGLYHELRTKLKAIGDKS